MLTATCLTAALVAYLAGAVLGLLSQKRARVARLWGCGFALLGAVLTALASISALAYGTVEWTIGSSVPLFAYSFALDGLSAYFNLALAVLGVAVSIYSFGYLESMEGRRNVGVLISLFNGLLLSLTIVFSASNAFLFMIGWELMALTAYGLVTYEHKSAESRNAGLLYLIMSHADAGCLLLGFALLGHAANSLDYSGFREAAGGLSANRQSAAFVLFLLGFGIKAGVIPVHVWLPAAHPVAPSNASALLSGIVIKTGIYGMARVFFEFLGDVPSWMGIVVLWIAIVSAILGVLYALMEHDLKRLLAYHSIENIGIILLGFGAAMMFRSSGHAGLAAVAFIAGLFHTLNHAIFKCLLFLGAGAVQHSTHTRNMEELGGLIRPMPATAFCFLVGAISISGLPPLNGFVSEWLTYQSLLAGFGTTHSLVGLLFPIAGSLLALTGALAAACFVKAFGITFLALPRSDEAKHAYEAPASMVAGMSVLAFACFALGIGATWFLPVFDGITQQVMGTPNAANTMLANSFVISAGPGRGGSVSTVWMAALLALAILGAGGLFAIKVRQSRNGPVWDCGLPGLGPQNEYTATAFSKPIRMVFAALYQPRREIQALFDVSPYFPKAIRFESGIEQAFEQRLYLPVRRAVLWISGQMRAIQAGSVHLYLTYIFLTLILLLLFAVRS